VPDPSPLGVAADAPVPSAFPALPDRVRALVIGAGPAGLATSRELARRDVEHVVIERGPRVAACWAELYDSLRLHTGKHMSALPGMRFGRDVPIFPTRAHFVDYLDRYAAAHDVPLHHRCVVARLERTEEGWRAHTSRGTVEATAVVVATGIMSNPRVPSIPGREIFRGRVMHSVMYRRPMPFAGRRVLVVGVGNSGGEIASELARAGIDVTVSVRSGANVVPLTLAGVPIQYLSYLVRKLPRPAQEAVSEAVRRLSEQRRGPPVLPRPPHSPLDAIPLIGFHLVDEIRSGRVKVAASLSSFGSTTVRFTDGAEHRFDDVILATGFSPALGILRGSIRLDARGFAHRSDRVTSADHPGLFFVGQNYDASGGLFNIGRDAPLAAAGVAAIR
jgi:cation diffusion facilitator CzcD-associated flavoprotein CzcO